MANIDVLARGARVIDGSGSPWFYGDVAVTSGRVHSIAPPDSMRPGDAGEIIDAEGMVVCPGSAASNSSRMAIALRMRRRCRYEGGRQS